VKSGGNNVDGKTQQGNNCKGRLFFHKLRRSRLAQQSKRSMIDVALEESHLPVVDLNPKEKRKKEKKGMVIKTKQTKKALKKM
jgi:hypothetical protein